MLTNDKETYTEITSMDNSMQSSAKDLSQLQTRMRTSTLGAFVIDFLQGQITYQLKYKSVISLIDDAIKKTCMQAKKACKQAEKAKKYKEKRRKYMKLQCDHDDLYTNSNAEE